MVAAETSKIAVFMRISGVFMPQINIFPLFAVIEIGAEK